MSGFRICDNKGFHITFENGYTVSVQFGFGNYADNYGVQEIPHDGARSTTAEVAAWGPKGWIWDDPRAQQTPAEVLAILNEVAKL